MQRNWRFSVTLHLDSPRLFLGSFWVMQYNTLIVVYNTWGARGRQCLEIPKILPSGCFELSHRQCYRIIWQTSLSFSWFLQTDQRSDDHLYRKAPLEVTTRRRINIFRLWWSPYGGILHTLYLIANSISEPTIEKKNFTITSNFRQQFQRSNRTFRSIDWKLVNWSAV